MGITILSDAETAQPLAIISSNIMTAMRTSAATAVAAKYLANKDSSSICLLGAGLEGKYHAIAFNELFPLETVRIVSKRGISSKKLAHELSEININSSAYDLPFEAANDADIIIGATSSTKPLISKEFIKEGIFIACISAGRHIDFQIDMNFDKIVIDDKSKIMRGTQVSEWIKKLDPNTFYEIGDITSGRYIGRKRKDERDLFISTGMGNQDNAIAEVIYQKAIKMGIGKWLKLF